MICCIRNIDKFSAMLCQFVICIWVILYFKELEGKASSDESSSDDEHTWKEEQQKELKKTFKKKVEKSAQNKPKFYEVKETEDFKTVHVTDTTTQRTNR